MHGHPAAVLPQRQDLRGSRIGDLNRRILTPERRELDLDAISEAVAVGGLRIKVAPDRRGTILKYRADRGPIAYVLAVFILRLGIWAVATPLICGVSVIPLALLGMFIAPINHHHQHVNSFRAPWLNRIYEVILALQSGAGPYNWVLHHNLGHHLNYLNQPPHESPDESRWTRADGTQMGRLEYSARQLLYHQIDIVRIGLRHPRYFRYFLLMKLPLWGLIGVGLWLRPLETVLVFLLPACITLTHTVWATYEHHAGCSPSNHLAASRNRDNRIYNFMTGNLGFHTAHHKRPGLHWSLLPELHERIRAQIPREQILKTFW
jgi:fatty acid desaturase